MLKEQLRPERIIISPDRDWEQAVRAAARPLVSDGSVEPRYVDAIVEGVRAPGGTYMDLGYGITLAHARPEAGATRTAVSIAVLTHGASLNDDPAHPVSVVIVLAAQDTDSHQQTMAELAEILIDEERRARLLAARSPADVLAAVADDPA